MDREQAFDAELLPLLEQMAEVCQQYGINGFMRLHIGTTDRPTLCVNMGLGDNHEVILALVQTASDCFDKSTEYHGRTH